MGERREERARSYKKRAGKKECSVTFAEGVRKVS